MKMENDGPPTANAVHQQRPFIWGPGPANVANAANLRAFLMIFEGRHSEKAQPTTAHDARTTHAHRGRVGCCAGSVHRTLRTGPDYPPGADRSVVKCVASR